MATPFPVPNRALPRISLTNSVPWAGSLFVDPVAHRVMPSRACQGILRLGRIAPVDRSNLMSGSRGDAAERMRFGGRQFARVARINDRPQTIHEAGVPGQMVPMEWAAILLLEPDENDPGGPATLYRYSTAGALAGDTWHATLDSAYDQAEFEYREALSEWQAVPSEVANAHEWVKHLIAPPEPR